MTSKKRPSVPRGTSQAGRRLWLYVVEEFDLEPHELALLREATRTLDALERLDEIWRAEGPMVKTGRGSKPHPALVEARQQKIALARLLAALRVPDDDEMAGRRQRRVGFRGVYGRRGA